MPLWGCRASHPQGLLLLSCPLFPPVGSPRCVSQLVIADVGPFTSFAVLPPLGSNLHRASGRGLQPRGYLACHSVIYRTNERVSEWMSECMSGESVRLGERLPRESWTGGPCVRGPGFGSRLRRVPPADPAQIPALPGPALPSKEVPAAGALGQLVCPGGRGGCPHEGRKRAVREISCHPWPGRGRLQLP